MSNKLRISLAQLNPKVGDIKSNLELAHLAFAKAKANDSDVLMFPELFLSGYFPDDLLFKGQFIKDAINAAKQLAKASAEYNFDLLLPTIWLKKGKLYNAIIHARDGKIIAKRFKHELPNDDVFYEKRYFEQGKLPKPITVKGIKIGLPICEDIWHKSVCAHLAKAGAELLLCPNGSPYWKNKHYLRRELVKSRVRETGLPLLYLNQVGGQDELVFDGASFGYNAKGELAFEGESFKEDFIVTDWSKTDGGWQFEQGRNVDLVSIDEAPWRACVLGLRDYLHKNGFEKVVLGLSGGIDSALVAAIAVDAIGADNVHTIMMPYRYTSKSSLDDAKLCAKNLGVRYDIVEIAKPVEAALDGLSDIFAGHEKDVTEENIQSRIRGTILMAVSNKLGSMLLTTGNKSEMAVGYATIYGDMNGGFNPIKDLTKMQVYHFANWRNENMPDDCLGKAGEIIPKSIINKAPSAELAEGQVDQDSLPPYPVLDAILEAMVEQEKSISEIVKLGFDYTLVKRIEKMLNIAEYKRRQSAPGVKLTKKAFGMGRKYPITNGYRDESNKND